MTEEEKLVLKTLSDCANRMFMEPAETMVANLHNVPPGPAFRFSYRFSFADQKAEGSGEILRTVELHEIFERETAISVNMAGPSEQEAFLALVEKVFSPPEGAEGRRMKVGRRIIVGYNYEEELDRICRKMIVLEAFTDADPKPAPRKEAIPVSPGNFLMPPPARLQ